VATRRSAASRPDLENNNRWKVQLELAPSEIAFVYRKGLARGAEVCRRGTEDWRPLVTTPELREALAKRASLAEMIEVAPPSPAAHTLSQTLAISDPSLTALFLAQRSTQLPKSTPPPPPPAVAKSEPPPPLPPAVAKSEPPPPLPLAEEPQTLVRLARVAPLVNRDSLPDWEDTPLLPLRLEPAPLQRQITLPSARLLARAERAAPVQITEIVEPVVLHARPIELSLVAVVATVLTLVVTALILRAEAPKLNALISTGLHATAKASPVVAAALEPRAVAPSGIPVVVWHDLPREGGRSLEGGKSVEGSKVTGPLASPIRISGSAPAGHTGAVSSGPDRASLARALSGAASAARNCGDGPVNARVMVTFAPSGVARSIHFVVPPPVALRSCVLSAVARSRVTPFEGDPITVSKSMHW
jgi:hypothetical protein